MNWTPEQEDQLKQLYAGGVSYEKIAAAISPDLTRSAVAGKIKRLGLVGANKQAHQRRPHKKTKNKPAKKFVESKKIPGFGESKPLPKEDTTLQPLRTYAELNRDECSWPYGDDPKSYRFCGRPRTAISQDRLHSYCEHHRELSKRGSTEKSNVSPSRTFRAHHP